MLDLLGLIGDRLIMIGTGIFAAFVYPGLAQEAVERGHGSDDQAKRIRWMRIAGYVLIAVGVLLAVFDLASPAVAPPPE
ncbi:MAG: hypothetical protein ACRBF0_08755 [Calditrichia bacterium]